MLQQDRIDTATTALYNESDVRQIAAEAAQSAVANYFFWQKSGTATLDNRIDLSNVSSEPMNGGTDMDNRMKVKIMVNGQPKWVCGDNPQKLADRIITLLTAPEPEDMTPFDEYAEKYISLYKDNGSIESNTLNGYRSYMKRHLLPFFGDTPLSRITSDDIQRYINEKAKTLTAKTVKEHLNVLRPIFEAAVEDGLIAKNPCTSARVKIIGQKSRKVLAYTESEFKQFEQLLSHLDGSAQLYLALSLYTGMRRGELFALRWENIDIDHHVLKVTQAVAWAGKNQGIIKTPKTAKGVRSIIIIPQLAQILKLHVQSSGYVLTSRHCNPEKPMSQQAVRYLDLEVQNAAKVNGIAVSFLSHRARHTVATFLNNAGADDVSITGIIGHSDVAFTKRQYTNTQTEQLERGMERFSNFVANIPA